MQPPPHHRTDGGYRNPWPGEQPRGTRDLLRWWRERRHRRHDAPADFRPPVIPSRFLTPRAPRHVLTATWVGHASVLLQLGGVNVLTDPIWSRRAGPLRWVGPSRVVVPAVPLDALPPVDLVLISHNHYDHLDRRTVRDLVRRHPSATWFSPLGTASMITRWGARHVRQLDWWSTAESGEATVACVPARHFSSRTPWDRNRTLWCGWTVSAQGWRVYFAGDTAYHPEFHAIAAQHGPFHLVLLPIGAYAPQWLMGGVHMDPDEAMTAYSEICRAHPSAPVPAMLPIHWGTFRLTDEPMHEPPARVRAGWEARGLDPKTLWLMAHGETRHREGRE